MRLIKENIQPLADDLMSYCQKHLGYESNPSLHFQEDEQNSMNPLGRTAHYSPDENKVVVYVTGRHVKDVLRSLAHELVHHLQNTRGEFDVAHDTGPGYAQKDGHMRNMEKEAYLLGNLLFRDWEDQKKLQESKQMKRSKLEEMVRKVLMEKLQNEEKMPDKNKDGIPDYAQDGKGANDLGKAKGVDSDDKDEKSDKKSDKDMSKVPPQLRKHVAKKMDEQEELEEGGAAMRQGNEDKDQGRERMLPDRIKEEEEVDEMRGMYSYKRNPETGKMERDTDSEKKNDAMARAKRRTGVGGDLPGGGKGFGGVYTHKSDDEASEKVGDATVTPVKVRKMNEEDVEEGMGMAAQMAKAKEGDKKPEPPKKGSAPIATNRLKKEYEDKFADIEATSKLHETKQERLNKRLMEWCTK